MAIYGFGAYYDRDVSKEFISNGLACLGWSSKKAPSLHKLLKHIKIGDLIYIKSHPPDKGLTIKAVGIILDDTLSNTDMGTCLNVEWIWSGYNL